jgi:hypothetical protein
MVGDSTKHSGWDGMNNKAKKNQKKKSIPEDIPIIWVNIV